MSELAQRLTETERERTHPNRRPSDAATLILIDRRGSGKARGPKVLMGRRHPGSAFMPGKFVFPGGRVDAGDRRMVAANALEAHVEAKLMARVQRPAPGRARALALAAIRETYEETGLLLGRGDWGPPEAVPAGWAAFAERGIMPDLEAIHFIARAITQPKRPRRFDARFFAVDAEAIGARIEGVTGTDAELVELVWLSIKEARALDLPTITGVVLEELEARIAAGFAPRLPVPFYQERQRRWVREEL